jgi:hypothetical protein
MRFYVWQQVHKLGRKPTLEEMDRFVSEDMVSEHAAGEPSKFGYLLRPDGDTDVYKIIDGKLEKTRRKGHVTPGLSIAQSDLRYMLPLVIFA